MKKKICTSIKRITLICLTAVFLSAMIPGNVHATESEDLGNNVNAMTRTNDTNAMITDTDRGDADKVLLYHMNSLLVRYDENSVEYQRLQDLFNSAVYYIAYTDMTIAQLQEYVASIKTQMNGVVSQKAVTDVTSEFIQVADNWETPTVYYGQKVSIVLPIINLGTEELNDLVIEPVVSTDVKEWPFEPDQTGYVQTEPFIPGFVSLDNAMANRREFTYSFTVRKDVMTGYYPLKFAVSFTRAGVRTEKATELTVYVQTIGKPESGYIGGNGNEDKKSKSRIIVTGYETNLDKINSGDEFELTIHVQNTSAETSVTNILINLSSEWNDSSGSGNAGTTVSPFMPTSGSNSIYLEKIGPKEIKDIKISMSSRSGLAQMSYPLIMDMTYDSGNQFDLQDKTSISIPVYQEAKFDTSNTDVSPASINVGSQSNVMFSIYNTGKTTLYNVQVKFSADSIEDNMAFVGNLTSGATGNVDVMLTGVSPTMDDGNISVIISYEDEAGNVTEVDRSCALYVNEVMDDYYNEGMRDPSLDEEPADHSTLKRGIIIAVVVLIIAAIVGVVVGLKKKKKEAALLEADLQDIEDLESIEEDNKDNTSDSEK